MCRCPHPLPPPRPLSGFPRPGPAPAPSEPLLPHKPRPSAPPGAARSASCSSIISVPNHPLAMRQQTAWTRGASLRRRKCSVVFHCISLRFHEHLHRASMCEHVSIPATRHKEPSFWPTLRPAPPSRLSPAACPCHRRTRHDNQASRPTVPPPGAAAAAGAARTPLQGAKRLIALAPPPASRRLGWLPGPVCFLPLPMPSTVIPRQLLSTTDSTSPVCPVASYPSPCPARSSHDAWGARCAHESSLSEAIKKDKMSWRK